MHLTRFTDYSIRVLIFLAAKGEERSTINEIAETFNISRNHLMKIVQELSQKNYVTAIRGKNGGLLLTRDPATIRLGELVRDMEHDMGLVECFHSDNACIITPACRLQPILNDALSAFLSVLDHYTLADLLGSQQSQLAQLMRIPTVSA
ncbi:Rrf2 family transcriptional regulator [Vreelandella venusta]|uniref:Rrf2 family transcriptional regulator n=1 Tax=Vreelandella venusta TaxID=44935 RepID=A0AAP9ZAD4_9GAMM|nr:Rrf2 family transcriptional regulator [Halomonas venusta]MBR9923422.1 Rrf2 family transcriptional regulator [Gammaproteobacteria bacterium]AZM96151.1 Rrf2 family transcriptional regulator [Halomonas venusta]MDW0358048.1 Rrf2 family transcriptional regulator [Halomonas venusta]MDX1356017.1 Rrf2 family transcriptional regulator [Halomonas venusta]NPT30553.1 Rrf2 family transcriptional regulator [Halomonas venusta]